MTEDNSVPGPSKPADQVEATGRVIADRKPAVVELEAGTYFWCVCGKSESQPFCDGSHKGGEFRPVRFDLEEPSRVALCCCKHTGNEPYCDGAHKNLE